MASNHASCIQNGAISPCWSVQSGLRTRRGFFHVSTESTSPSAWMEKTGSAFGWPFFLPCVSVGLRSSQTPCTVLFSSSMKRSGMVFKSSAVIAFASSNCFLASASFFRRFCRSCSYSSKVCLCLRCASASASSACLRASSLAFCRCASPSAVSAGFTSSPDLASMVIESGSPRWSTRSNGRPSASKAVR